MKSLSKFRNENLSNNLSNITVKNFKNFLTKKVDLDLINDEKFIFKNGISKIELISPFSGDYSDLDALSKEIIELLSDGFDLQYKRTSINKYGFVLELIQ